MSGRGLCLEIAHFMNAFHHLIRITHDESEDFSGTAYLDVKLLFERGHTEYSTNWKQLGKHLHLPVCSDHPLASRMGVASTEVLRMLRTNSSKAEYLKQCRFFAKKL